MNRNQSNHNKIEKQTLFKKTIEKHTNTMCKSLCTLQIFHHATDFSHLKLIK